MSDSPVKKGRGRPAKAKVEETASPKAVKKDEKKVEEAPKKVEESTKPENGAAPKKGRGRPSKGDKAAPKRPASGKGRGRPAKAKKVEVDDAEEGNSSD
ncbi:high mobility group protein I [Chironomus tepperi]|uniref:high mobility group protein I n=1 Tax=Chironomus tepperi TaxID=113505 RepID=UPI00391EF95E